MGIHKYEKPSLTTDMVLFRVKKEEVESKRKTDKLRLEVLLVEREIEPQMGYLALPGGFVSIDEGIEDNVKRKIREKTGLYGEFYIEQLYTKGELDRDPRGRVVSVSYLGLANEETLWGILSDNANWYSVEELDRETLAFDHKEILEYAIERVENKVEYTDIAFNLLPTEFTVAEVQETYEMLLKKEILNFRRKIKDYVKPLNKRVEGKQHRPAELFTLNNKRESKF